MFSIEGSGFFLEAPLNEFDFTIVPDTVGADYECKLNGVNVGRLQSDGDGAYVEFFTRVLGVECGFRSAPKPRYCRVHVYTQPTSALFLGGGASTSKAHINAATNVNDKHAMCAMVDRMLPVCASGNPNAMIAAVLRAEDV